MHLFKILEKPGNFLVLICCVALVPANQHISKQKIRPTLNGRKCRYENGFRIKKQGLKMRTSQGTVFI